MKKNAKKGFTLIEIIVVLVILAILAAAAIPTMNGFINEAKGKQYIAEARAAMLGCKALEAQFVPGETVKEFTCVDGSTEITKYATKATALAGVDGTILQLADVDGNAVYQYTNKGATETITITEGEGTVVKAKN